MNIGPQSNSISNSNKIRQAYDFYANFHFTAVPDGKVVEDIEAANKCEEFPFYDGCSEVDSVTKEDVPPSRRIYRQPTPLFEQHIKAYDDFFAPLNRHTLSNITKLFLIALIFPLSVFAFIKQIRVYVVIAVFNYTGYNLRTKLLLDIETERDIMIREVKFKGKPITLNKAFFLAEKYMMYWLIVLLLIIATPFINDTDIFALVHGFNFVENNNTLNYFAQVLISFVVAFANLIPSRAPRPDISSFLSAFSGEDYSIIDSAHTRLKDLSEILGDIKKYGFALLSTDSKTPIIVSTKAPEELSEMPDFIGLLTTSTFDTNQILRFIQIEEDVDTFFVLRNDVGMCHRIQYESLHFHHILKTAIEEKRLDCSLEVSNTDVAIYGGASFVLMVGLFVTTARVNSAAFLLSWAAWPLIAVTIFRRRQSMLASVNFFTLDGKDRKYQPFNNICVCSDHIILSKIRMLSCFFALSKFTVQENYLIHILLKVAETISYDWLNMGISVRDYKRIASLAVITYEKDVAIITPNSCTYYSAPRRQNELCVVCVINNKGDVSSTLMTPMQFRTVTARLPEGADADDIENMLLL